jgi:hypothetical protein
MKRLLLTIALASVPAPLFAQSAPPEPIPPVASRVSLAGPRFGLTVLSDAIVDKLKTEDYISVGHAISQFGWQFERGFYSKESGPTVLNEWVVLVGGLDQGVVLPSLSWLVGLRTHDGVEFGIGPNLTPVGAALVVAAGITLRAGVLNVPMNIAVVPSKDGTRVSMLTGFTLRR